MKKAHSPTLPQTPAPPCPASPDVLMNWSIKARVIAPRDLRNNVLLITFSMAALASVFLWMGIGVSGLSIFALMYVLAIVLLTVRTHFNFELNRDGASASQHVPSTEAGRTTVVALIVIEAVVMFFLAVFTGTWMLLLIPAFVAFAFLTRAPTEATSQDPLKRNHSAPWHTYRYLTVDRKRRMLIPHISNLDVGFELRLPDAASFEQCLALLRELLPGDVEYLERDWEHA